MMSRLETCDLCGEIRPLRDVHFDGHQFLCRKCRETPKVASNGSWRHVEASGGMDREKYRSED